MTRKLCWIEYWNFHNISWINQMVNLFAWTWSLASMLIIIFINYPLIQLDSTATPLEFGLYDALSRVIWSIALCYIIFACINNHGGLVNSILAHPLFKPISRLCYSIYLMHFFVIRMTMASIKSSVYFSELNAVSFPKRTSGKIGEHFAHFWNGVFFHLQVHAFIGNFILTIFVSLVATLAFESPLITIVKIIFTPQRATSNDENKPNQIREKSKNSQSTEQN